MTKGAEGRGSNGVMRRYLPVFAALLSLCGAHGCSGVTEQTVAPPKVVHIPLGWLGITKQAKSAPANDSSGSETSETTVATTEALEVAEAPVEVAPVGPKIVELASTTPRSQEIRNGFFNPIPGGVFAGYAGDTGLDIASPARPVFAIASGTLDYSEKGHTLWVGKFDTPNSVRLKLDVPIPWKGHLVTHVYYTHLSALVVEQPENGPIRHHVVGGEQLGVSGVANGLPHLHLGLLLDGQVEQDSWSTLLKEKEIRALLGGYVNGEKLPKLP